MNCNVFFYVLVFCQLCVVISFEFRSQTCHNKDNHVGKCVPPALCSQESSKTDDSDLIINTCEVGTVCCRVSAKIVTPDNRNSIPASSFGSLSASPAVEVFVSSQSGGTVSGGGSPPSGSPPGGSAPSSGTSPPNGSAPSNGSVPPSGSTPPSGSSPPSGSTPPGGGSPSTGGASPPSGAPPSGGSPPPLMGNIVADPELPSKTQPAPGYPSPVLDDTIVVSAEVTDNGLDIADRKCELYYSMSQEPTSTSSTLQQINTPRVMIYGGVNSQEKEFPHMAALGFGEPNAKQWLCGGSLITEYFVVTAAHCLSAEPLREVRYVKLGTIYLNQDTPNTQLLNVIRRIPYYQYNKQGQYNDIALLQLDQAVRINSYVAPICLFPSTNYEDKNLVATGWGKTDSGSPSLTLHKVGLELFPQSECQSVYQQVSRQQLPYGIQGQIQLCAGSHSQNKDTCQGDSGGPLQIRKNNRWYLIGITSLGLKCGEANVPGVYTRLAPFIEWIKENVWNK